MLLTCVVLVLCVLMSCLVLLTFVVFAASPRVLTLRFSLIHDWLHLRVIFYCLTEVSIHNNILVRGKVVINFNNYVFVAGHQYFSVSALHLMRHFRRINNFVRGVVLLQKAHTARRVTRHFLLFFIQAHF